MRNRGWVTLHAEAGETGMGETPNSVLAPFRLSAARPYSHELVLRPLTRAELAAGGVAGRRRAGTVPAGGHAHHATAGSSPARPSRCRSRSPPRCAAGLRDATVRLTAPDGWTVQPASADLGTVAGPETAAFTVTAPAGTDLGTYRLTATAVTTTPDGFRSTTTATATTEAPLPPGYQWLSDRPFTAPANGWGPVEKDRSNGEQGAADGNPLTIGDVVYPKGLGTHAVSTVQTELGGRLHPAARRRGGRRRDGHRRLGRLRGLGATAPGWPRPAC